MEEKKWLRPSDIARELDVAEGTVRTWIREGSLKAAQFGKGYRVKREDYEEFIRQSYKKKDQE